MGNLNTSHFLHTLAEEVNLLHAKGFSAVIAWLIARLQLSIAQFGVPKQTQWGNQEK